MGKSDKKAQKAQASKNERIAALQNAANEQNNRAGKFNLLALLGGCVAVGSLGAGLWGVIEEGSEGIPPLVTTTSVFALVTGFSIATVGTLDNKLNDTRPKHLSWRLSKNRLSL